ncbi:formate/nitrite transporter family protein [Nitrobacter hamburgensis]|uniref:formate/nitrite transporter family protein n=1 Tax=Nitrobacter hamburgensis TaxID=912 RepID=UPI0000555AE8|nr:formate/nitrite transporter family protein [Nitrobacter hamburgensis]
MHQDTLDFSDAAKCILIFWCLFAFSALGFVHSTTNMTLFSIALLGQHPDLMSVGGMFYNLLWVTLGNAIAGFCVHRRGLLDGHWQSVDIHRRRRDPRHCRCGVGTP